MVASHRFDCIVEKLFVRFFFISPGQRPSDFNSMDMGTMGDNEHSNMDSDDLVPSLQVSGLSGTGGWGD